MVASLVALLRVDLHIREVQAAPRILKTYSVLVLAHKRVQWVARLPLTVEVAHLPLLVVVARLPLPVEMVHQWAWLLREEVHLQVGVVRR